jgi:hypothetical protein
MLNLYFQLRNSFIFQGSKPKPDGGLSLGLSARDRLDINLTSSFAEVAITTLNMWSKEGMSVLQKARGTYAPYRIRNKTGTPILVWSESDVGTHAPETEALPVHNDRTIDWRFGDWRATREVVVSPLLTQYYTNCNVSRPIRRLGSILSVFSLSIRHGNKYEGFLSTGKENMYIHFGLKAAGIRKGCFAK